MLNSKNKQTTILSRITNPLKIFTKNLHQQLYIVSYNNLPLFSFVVYHAVYLRETLYYNKKCTKNTKIKPKISISHKYLVNNMLSSPAAPNHFPNSVSNLFSTLFQDPQFFCSVRRHNHIIFMIAMAIVDCLQLILVYCGSFSIDYCSFWMDPLFNYNSQGQVFGSLKLDKSIIINSL